MIRQLEVKGLRALRYVSVDLEPFLVMVGPVVDNKDVA